MSGYRPTTPGGRVDLVLEGFPHGGTPKLVMIGIASHDGEGGSWPSVPTLARYAAVTPRNVQKAIDKLAEAGWLVVHQNEGGTRNTRADRRTNLYEVNYQRLVDGVSEASPREESARGVASDARGVSLATERGVAGDALTGQEQDKEQDPSGSEPGGSLPGIDTPAERPEPIKIAWRLIRLAYDARDTKPIENRQHVAQAVARLVTAGWTEDELAKALKDAPAWTPTSIQVELTRNRSGRGPGGRRVKDTDEDMRGDYAEQSGWGALRKGQTT